MSGSPDGHANSEKGANMSSLYPTQTLSPDQFERLYLQPKPVVGGELRKVVGNPTPMALVGFCVGLTPIAAQFMGWAGSGGNATATTTASIWFGGMLLGLAGLMEFLLGNTYTFTVFMTFSAHFLTFATAGIPWFNTLAPYTTDGVPAPTPAWASGFGTCWLAYRENSVINLASRILRHLDGSCLVHLADRRTSHESGVRHHLHRRHSGLHLGWHLAMEVLLWRLGCLRRFLGGNWRFLLRSGGLWLVLIASTDYRDHGASHPRSARFRPQYRYQGPASRRLAIIDGM